MCLYILHMYIFYTIVYIFMHTFEIKCALVGLKQGHAGVPWGECHSMHLEPPFPSS